MLSEIIIINNEMKKVAEDYSLNYITVNEYEKRILDLYEKKTKKSIELVNQLIQFKEYNRTDLLNTILN